MRYKNEVDKGTVAKDVVNDSMVIVVNEDVGTVGEQDNPLNEMIVENEGNRAVGFDADTRCVECIYASLSGENDRTYTFPITRLAVPNINLKNTGNTVKDMIVYQTLYEVFAGALTDEAVSKEEYDTMLGAIANADLEWDLVEDAEEAARYDFGDKDE